MRWKKQVSQGFIKCIKYLRVDHDVRERIDKENKLYPIKKPQMFRRIIGYFLL